MDETTIAVRVSYDDSPGDVAESLIDIMRRAGIVVEDNYDPGEPYIDYKIIFVEKKPT